MDEVKASVGEPTKVPERPTLYLVVFYDDRGYWAIDSLHGVKDYADMKHTTRPGSVLVTIPGSSAPVAQPEPSPADGLEWEIRRNITVELIAAFADPNNATGYAADFENPFTVAVSRRLSASPAPKPSPDVRGALEESVRAMEQAACVVSQEGTSRKMLESALARARQALEVSK